MISLQTKESINSIAAHDMKDGDVAIIVEWNTMNCYKNKIVQRYGQHLAVLGTSKGNSWPSFFDKPKDNRLRVRLLEKDEILVIS